MIRFIIVWAVFLNVFTCCILAQDTDSRIVLSNKEEVYTYMVNRQGEIQVNAEYIANFKSLKPGTASVIEYYDNYSEIKDVKVTGIKGVTPAYGMYRRENIFFSDSKACYFDIPFIKSDLEAVVSVHKLYKDVRRFDFLPLAESYYIASKVIKFVVPDWMNVEFLLQNGSDNIQQKTVRDEDKKTTTYLYHIKNQPEVIVEPYSIGYEYLYPYITILPKEAVIDGNTIPILKTVDDLYKWYKDPVMLLHNDEKAIDEKAAILTADCSSDEDKIRNLCNWVQHNIRYIAFVDGISAYKPDDAHEVINKKYGDCKGMSNLLKALLVSAGFDARLTWVSSSSGYRKDLDMEAPSLFANHMICALFMNDNLYFIDPTVRSLSFGEIPLSIQGRKALIEDGEKYIVRQIPEFDLKSNKDSLFINCSITNDRMISQESRTFKGEAKHHIAYWMNSLKGRDREAVITEFLRGEETHDTISNIITRGLDDFLPLININYEAVRKSAVHLFGNQTYINLEVYKDFQQAKIDTSRRKTGFRLPYKEYMVRVSELSLTENYSVVQIPENIEINRQKYSFILSYKQNNNKLIYYKKIIIFDPVIDKNEFEQWNNDIDTLRKAYNELVVLENRIK